MEISSISYALLGALIGIIFVLDGWRSPADRDAPFQNSPRIRGVLFILGGGVIPAIQALATGSPELTAWDHRVGGRMRR